MTSNGANEKDNIRISNEDDGINITINNEYEEANIWIGNEENKEESSDHERDRTIIRIKSVSNSIIVSGGKNRIEPRISAPPSSSSSSE